MQILNVKKEAPKTASKKVPRQSPTRPYPRARRLPERQPRVRTVQTRNSCWSSSWSTVRDFWRKKWTGLKIGMKNWLDCWIVANKTEWIAETCWLLKTKANVETESVGTTVETNVQGRGSDTLWAKARRILGFLDFHHFSISPHLWFLDSPNSACTWGSNGVAKGPWKVWRDRDAAGQHFAL